MSCATSYGARRRLLLWLPLALAVAPLQAHAQGTGASGTACASAAKTQQTFPGGPVRDPVIAAAIARDSMTAASCRRASPAMSFAEPSGSVTVLSPVNALQLHASTDTKAKTVKAQVGVIDGDAAGASLGIGLGLEGPLDDSGERSELAQVTNLTSLSDATTASLNLQWYHWAPRLDDAALERYCNEIKPKTKVKDQPGLAWCFAGSKKVPKQYWDSLSSFVTDAGVPMTIAFSGRVGRQDVKFADATTLLDSSTTTTPWSVGGALGWYHPGTGTVYALTYNRVHATKPGKSTQLCLPITGGAPPAGALRCRTTTSGPPGSKDRNVIGGEIRRALSPGVGYAARLAHDVSDGVTSIEVPLYFLGTTTKGPSGGVVAGWSTEKHMFSLTVFVGALTDPVVVAPSP